VITAAPAAAGGGLLFSPLPELETLHNASTHLAQSLTVAAGQSVRQAGVDTDTGLHHHIKLNVTLEVAGTFSICVQCDGAHPGVVTRARCRHDIRAPLRVLCMENHYRTI
jgi:hypothetical protein